ncbi:MAG: hypothetical protein COA73_17500 [Candidatus Hydrogenedentota bacterium]|nr:MAG: hypothetical protein COA73_17500 [Candidatus Hydrogenedentota bacterium]
MKFASPLLAAILILLGLHGTATAHTRITTDLNWSNEIRAIMEDKCMTCHHPGGIAPDYINLTTYGTDTDPGARAWAVAIEEEILTGRMPPWKPDDRFSDFSNSKALTQLEIDKIVAWVRGGAPQGPIRNLPMPEQFEKPTWRFGQPDLVFELSEPFVLPPDEMTGETQQVFDVEIEEDTFITGYEFLAEDPKNIYSIEAWLLEPEGSDATKTIEVEIVKEYDPLADEDDLEIVEDRTLPTGSQFLGQWIRGDHPVLFPDEAGRLLRKGSKIRMAIQYARPDYADTSMEIRDQSKLGLFLAGEGEEIDLLIESFEMAQDGFSIKANKRDHKVETSYTMKENVHLVSVSPRMGPVAQDIEVTITYPDGRGKTLLWIPEFQQKWTSSYIFDEPVAAPAGSILSLIGRYDNTEDNWDNPNSPPEDISSGTRYLQAKLSAVVDYQLDTHLKVEEIFIPKERPEVEGSGGMSFATPITLEEGGTESIDGKDVGSLEKMIKETRGEL